MAEQDSPIEENKIIVESPEDGSDPTVTIETADGADTININVPGNFTINGYPATSAPTPSHLFSKTISDAQKQADEAKE